VAVTIESFLKGFPEFKKTDPDLIGAKIDDATRQVDPDIWGDETDMGISYLAAHLISLAPFGTQSRRGNTSWETSYWKSYERLVRQHAGGFRVI
jgi:hypothetical protein